MSECRWCGTEYEWSDKVSSALCEDCASDEAQDLWGKDMAEEIAELLRK